MNFAGVSGNSSTHNYSAAFSQVIKQQQAAGSGAEAPSAEATRASLKAASEEFESIFVYQMLSAMRKTVGSGTLIPKSNAQEIFEGMLDEEWSRKLASKSGHGSLSEILYRELSRQMGLDEEAGTATATSMAERATQLADQLRARGMGVGARGRVSNPLLDLKTMSLPGLLMKWEQK